MSSAYTGMDALPTQVPQKPLGSWSQCEEQRHSCMSQSSLSEIRPHERTTIMLNNLPEDFSRDMVADLLSSQGFEKKLGFIYTPMKFSGMITIGYAFVNLVSSQAAEECLSRLSDFTDWATPCENSLSAKMVWQGVTRGDLLALRASAHWVHLQFATYIETMARPHD